MRVQGPIQAYWVAAVVSLGASVHAAEDAGPNSVPPYITAAVANPIRPLGDTQRDAGQRPAQVLAFAGVKPGDRIADFWPAPPLLLGKTDRFIFKFRKPAA